MPLKLCLVTNVFKVGSSVCICLWEREWCVFEREGDESVCLCVIWRVKVSCSVFPLLPQWHADHYACIFLQPNMTKSAILLYTKQCEVKFNVWITVTGFWRTFRKQASEGQGEQDARPLIIFTTWHHDTWPDVKMVCKMLVLWQA